ncbi:MAG: hypothetical protein RLP15_12920 [Cryomorphaceae bacterium]
MSRLKSFAQALAFILLATLITGCCSYNSRTGSDCPASKVEVIYEVVGGESFSVEYRWSKNDTREKEDRTEEGLSGTWSTEFKTKSESTHMCNATNNASESVMMEVSMYVDGELVEFNEGVVASGETIGISHNWF